MISNYLRSLCFSFLMFTSAFVLSFVCLFTFPLPYKKRYYFIAMWPRFVIWSLNKICHIHFKIIGQENIPTSGAIIVSNHQSTWETMAFFQIFPYTTFVLKRELLQIPIFGWTLRLIEPIALNRKKGSAALEQLLSQGIDRLNKERLITIFPEGHRMPVTELGKFKMGAANLAAKSGRMIIPVTHDAGKFWSRRSFIKKPGTITLIAGEPIDPKGLEVLELNRKIVAVIKAQQAKLANENIQEDLSVPQES